jgi:hypothetical protein
MHRLDGYCFGWLCFAYGSCCMHVHRLYTDSCPVGAADFAALQ